MEKLNDMLTNKELDIKNFLFYFLILSLIFLLPFNTVFLVVNEELFVVISFFIFVDLFGNNIINGVSDAADLKIHLIINKFALTLTQKFVIFLEIWSNLLNLLKLDVIKRGFLKNFYQVVLKVLKNRKKDFLYLGLSITFFNYKTCLRFNFSNMKLLSIFIATNFVQAQYNKLLLVKNDFKPIASEKSNVLLVNSFYNFLNFNKNFFKIIKTADDTVFHINYN